MTPEQQAIYDAARSGILRRLDEMKQSITMIESWLLYAEMERREGRRCAAISEESVHLDLDVSRGANDSTRSRI